MATVAIKMHTVNSGVVVRWYSSIELANARRDWVSASRDGITVTGVLGQRDRALLDQAWDVHERLVEHGQAVDLSDVVTHRRSLLFGIVEPIR